MEGVNEASVNPASGDEALVNVFVYKSEEVNILAVEDWMYTGNPLLMFTLFLFPRK